MGTVASWKSIGYNADSLHSKSILKHLPAFTVETVAQSMILRAIVSEFPRGKKEGRVEVLLFKCRFPGQPELTESNSLEGSLERCVFSKVINKFDKV